ncbi:hypothetical protein JCM11491_004313 [Sporobolomyces phaffii]
MARTASTSSVAQLVGLGIPKARALYALREFEGNAEVAADWCFADGAEWTPNDLLRTSHAPPPRARESDDDDDLGRQAAGSSRLSSTSTSTSGPPGWTRVPSRLVEPGVTRVAITLKRDQGTARTVTGVVAEKLSRGADHPRGIKVRLRDGQVGRIVRIVDAAEELATKKSSTS